MSYRCPLGRLLPTQTDPEELETIKQDGWREHGILVISVGDPRLNWMQEQVVEQIGKKLYGDFMKKGRG
jgi:hypothetical protein